jgi:hypothetical protein
MAGTATNYSSKFLGRMGEEILVEPLDSEELGGITDISDRQDFMKFVGENPAAAGDLLAGHHGRDDYFSNAATLMRYGRYTDDGEALGALITGGTHDLRGTDMALSNDASHQVMLAAPEYAEHMGDKAKPALVTILDDHIDDFEYVAADLSDPGSVDRPSNGIQSLTYDEAHNYLKTLVGDDITRADSTAIIGERVGDDIYHAASSGDTGYASRAGALSEMGVTATADAHLDDAKTQDAMNGFAKSASGKLLGFTPLNKVPGFDIVAGQGLDDIFSTDNVKNALDHQEAPQIDAYEGVKRLSIEAQVHFGQLPEESLKTINANGTTNVNFIDGPLNDRDIVKIDTDGDGVPDKNLEWDLDHDGTISAREKEITERDLYDAGLGISQAASEGATNIQHIHYDSKHAPDIDDLPIPDGYDNDNPNGFEKVMAWPFDADGEGVIKMDGHVVAHQDDLKWDGHEQVYDLPVKNEDGDTTDTLHYQRIGGDWEQVVKGPNGWQKVS